MTTEIVSAGLKKGDLRSFLQRMLNGEVFVTTYRGVVITRMLFDGKGFLVIVKGNEELYMNNLYFTYAANELAPKLKQEISVAEDENTAG